MCIHILAVVVLIEGDRGVLMILSQIKRCFISPITIFIIAFIAIYMLLYTLGFEFSGKPEFSIGESLTLSLSLGGGSSISNVICAMPFLIDHYFSYNKSAVKYRIIRCDKRRTYYLGTIFAGIVSTFLVCVVIIILYSLFCLLFGGNFNISDVENSFLSDIYIHPLLSKLFVWNTVPYILFTAFMYAVQKLPLVIFGLLMSSYTDNIYIILFAPKACFTLLQIISIMTKMYYIDLINIVPWSSAVYVYDWGLWYMIVYPLLLVCLFSYLYISHENEKYYRGII